MTVPVVPLTHRRVPVVMRSRVLPLTPERLGPMVPGVSGYLHARMSRPSMNAEICESKRRIDLGRR